MQGKSFTELVHAKCTELKQKCYDKFLEEWISTEDHRKWKSKVAYNCADETARNVESQEDVEKYLRDKILKEGEPVSPNLIEVMAELEGMNFLKCSDPSLCSFPIRFNTKLPNAFKRPICWAYTITGHVYPILLEKKGRYLPTQQPINPNVFKSEIVKQFKALDEWIEKCYRFSSISTEEIAKRYDVDLETLKELANRFLSNEAQLEHRVKNSIEDLFR